jgi:RND family efflux transporter MFP subunit
MNPFKRFGKTKSIVGIVVLVLIIFGIYYFAFIRKASPYQFVTVTQGAITEEVSVTGNTTPIQSLDLGFQNGGIIASVNKAVGDQVAAGDVLERLNTSDLEAQLAQAQANVDAANAQLQSLQAGAQPADIQNSEAALAGGQQSLANMYASAENTLNDSYTKANDAVRNQLSAFFTSAETNNPQITFSVSNSQTLNNAESERLRASTELNLWQSELATVNASSPSSTLDAALQNATAHLSVIKAFLNSVSQAILLEANLSPATLNTYNNQLTAANNEFTTATTNINTTIQNIASQKITIQQLQAQLNLKLAGSTVQQIANQQAQVEAAEANVRNVQVQINEATLASPIDGVVTVQNAKVGEIATPGTTMTSLISNDDFEVDSEVPETDIGKISIGQTVTMTIDAFSGETFAGKVFYIDPAQTDISGVVNYTVKVSFSKPDPRIKSGLTVNLDIQTQQQNNALILPQYAIIQSDQGTFVDVIQNGKEVQVPVTLGIQDQSGNVQILSGVTKGEQVVNIGIK